MARRSDIRVLKAVESKDEEPERRKRDNIEFARDLCDITEADYSSVKNVTRLGRRAKEEDNPTPRPMRGREIQRSVYGKFAESKSC